MRVLVTGATGIGSQIAAYLRAAGDDVRSAVHRVSAPGQLAYDFAQDLVPEAWLPDCKA